MSKTGPGISSLNERLRTKLSDDRERIEALTLSEQQKLAENLIAASKAEFARIRTTIEQETAATRVSVRSLLRWPLWTAAICVILVVISLTVLWAGTWWLREDLKALRAETEAQKSTLGALKDQTGGIEILPSSDGTFVILPQETDLRTTYRCGDDRPCLKMPR